MPHYDAILAAPPCRLGASFTGAALTRLDFLPADTAVSPRLDHRARALVRELDAYWQNPAHVFDLLYVPAGTPFQLRVWRALLQIRPGQPTTYGALARTLATAPRAVGQACGANPLPIVIPCHRVLAANGALGGFMHASSGAALEIKTWLLAHERPQDPPPPQPSDKATKRSPKPASGQVAACPASVRGSNRNARTD